MNIIDTDYNFDAALIQLLRIMIANFLRNGKNTAINEIEISDLLDNLSRDEFIENVVLKPNTDAKTIILNIAALVLRVNINNYMINSSDPELVLV